MEVSRLYPQYKSIQDRRQQSSSVQFERRIGEERRTESRIKLDTALTRDIFEARSTVAAVAKKDEIQAGQTFTGMIGNTSIGKKILNTVESLKASQMVIEGRKSYLEPSKTSEIEAKSGSTEVVGMAGGALAGIMSTMFFGAIGAVMGIGMAVYFGGKAVKNLVETHLINIKTLK